MSTSNATLAPLDSHADPLLLMVIVTGMLVVEAHGALQGLWLAMLALAWVWRQQRPALSIEQAQS